MKIFYYETLEKKHYPVEVTKEEAEKYRLKPESVVSKEFVKQVLKR